MQTEAAPEPSTRPDDVAALADWLANHEKIVVITGAGVSTESGIPDYRDGAGNWKRKAPLQHDEFVHDTVARRRYWARSLIGWPMFVAAQPSAAHQALARLERTGTVVSLVTQNVDGLHQRAGSKHVIDLHGRLDVVVCLNCANRTARDAFQQRLTELNPEWASLQARIAPDGDADLERQDFETFAVPACTICGGLLKPDVVFYGGSVPRARSEQAMAAVTGADGVLVAGSSLMVWSSFRLVRAANQQGIDVAAINRGHTRADAFLQLKCDGECGALLSAALERLA